MTDCHIAPLLSNDPRISVGRFTYGNPQFRIWAENERITIGSFCSIADDVFIFSGGEHRTDWVTTYPLRIALGSPTAYQDGHPATKGATKIGHDVWIGHGATILSGVNVGDGAIIGARALVATDVPPYHVVAGNPAKVLRARFTVRQVSLLCRISWWDWPIELIRKFEDLLCGPDIDKFIHEARQVEPSLPTYPEHE